ncbi:tyrosine-type recombinase/integrase [Candidatus Neomarinimicrobiota bacterium]
MASLVRFPGGSRNQGDKGRHGPYYAKVYIPRPGQRPKGKLIPLKTENTREAAIRLQEVEKMEALIKQGIEFTFPWMNGSPTAVKRITFQKAAREYLEAREDEGLRRKTLGIYSLALSHFLAVAGKDRPIEAIATKDVQAFIRAYRESHSVTTLNINLRALKTFFLWAHEAKLILEVPKVKVLQKGRELPRYLSNKEFDLVQAQTTPFLADVFWFYLETGCRLREPFNAVLKGSFLLVPTENSKGKEERQIPLNHDLIKVYWQLMEAGHDPKYYTDQFRKIVKGIGLEGHKFHDLRHTFGVRTWLQTGDIHLVSQLMGHKSILTTQIYARFFITRLQEDFPDLAGYATDRTKGRAEILQRGNGALVEKEVL